MLEIARTIFYGSNRFLFEAGSEFGSDFSPITDGYGEYREDNCIFDPIVKLSMVERVRSIEIIVPPRSDLYRRRYEAWVNDVHRLAEKVKKLEVRLYLCPDWTRYFFREYNNNNTRHKDAEGWLESIARWQEEIVTPWAAVKGLSDFYVIATMRWQLQVWDSQPSALPLVQTHEKRLEALVMGDSYDSIARGKWRRDPTSYWPDPDD